MVELPSASGSGTLARSSAVCTLSALLLSKNCVLLPALRSASRLQLCCLLLDAFQFRISAGSPQCGGARRQPWTSAVLLTDSGRESTEVSNRPPVI